MVSAHVLSIDVHRFVSVPLQHLQDGVWFQLISRSGIDRFLRCQRQLINELITVFEPPDPLSYYTFSPVNKSLSLFDIYPQPPSVTRKEKSKS